VAGQNLLSVMKFRVIECKCLGVEGAAGCLLNRSGKTRSSCTSEEVVAEAQGTGLAKGGNRRLCNSLSVGLRFVRSHGLLAPKQGGMESKRSFVLIGHALITASA